MKTPKQRREILLSLLQNTIFQFFVANLAILIIFRISSSIDIQSLQIIFKTLGYGFYFYLATPFILHWLAFASRGKTNRFKLTTTVTFMAMYSYFLWDAYFFFTKAINLFLSTTEPYQL